MQVHPNTCVLFSNPPERVQLNLGTPFRKQGRRVPQKMLLNHRQTCTAFKAPKNPSEGAVVGKTGANSGKSTIGSSWGVRIWVLFAKPQHAKKQTQQNPSSDWYQSGASQISERYAKTEPLPIVDLPETKGLLATSTTFLHAKRRARIATSLNRPMHATFFEEHSPCCSIEINYFSTTEPSCSMLRARRRPSQSSLPPASFEEGARLSFDS